MRKKGRERKEKKKSSSITIMRVSYSSNNYSRRNPAMTKRKK